MQDKKKSSIIFHECDHQVDNDDVIKNREGHGESNTQTHTLWCYCKDCLFNFFYIIFGSTLWGLLEFCLHFVFGGVCVCLCVFFIHSASLTSKDIT